MWFVGSEKPCIYSVPNRKQSYVKENTTELVDPLDVKKKMEALEEKRNTLLTELDTQIKVSNATTFIEVA